MVRSVTAMSFSATTYAAIIRSTLQTTTWPKGQLTGECPSAMWEYMGAQEGKMPSSPPYAPWLALIAIIAFIAILCCLLPVFRRRR
jgi:hypothetical protein